MLNIEAVTICQDYDDLLEIAIPYNLPMLDRWLIVTTPTDTKTRDLCRKHSIECLQTEDGLVNGKFANKGKMIERGLQHLREDGWRLHIDADIILPNYFHRLIELASLKEDCIYGCDRIMIRGPEQWEKFKKTGWLEIGHYSAHCNMNFPKGYEIGTRWIGKQVGYVPIGFFQLWHSSQDIWRGIRSKPYPKHHNSACRTDVQQALQWDRAKRILLPELLVVHLESQLAPNGANWNGRKTARWGEEPSSLGCNSCNY